MKITFVPLLILLTSMMLASCEPAEKAEIPKPLQPKEEAIGYFCNMLVSEHKGPKSQIHLKGQQEPLWFTSVRDGIAYTKLPEESRAVSVLYVTAIDSMTEFNLDHPELSPDSWVAADWALYVIDSNLRGGMGAMEAFPFREGAQATLFMEMYGGRIVRFSDIPEGYVLGNSETLAERGSAAAMDHSGMKTAEH